VKAGVQAGGRECLTHDANLFASVASPGVLAADIGGQADAMCVPSQQLCVQADLGGDRALVGRNSDAVERGP
jgi:hypothetical protein